MSAFDKIFEEFVHATRVGFSSAQSAGIPIRDTTVATAFFALFDDVRSNPGGNLGTFLKFAVFAMGHAHQSHAQIAQDLWIAYMTGGKRSGFFVEIGAGDGKDLSNTLMLERDFGWTGLLVEPNPDFQEPLAQNRTAIHEPSACITDKRKSVSFQMMSDHHLSRVAGDYAQALHDRIGTRRELKRIKVPAARINTILARHKVSAIDYMSIDIEGGELELIQDLDFSKYKPKMITIEHNWSDQLNAISDHLLAQGYQLWCPEFARQDFFFYLPEAIIPAAG